MRTHTDTAAAVVLERSGLQQPPRYGTPSPALLARADRGFARFLAQHTQDQGDGDGGRQHT